MGPFLASWVAACSATMAPGAEELIQQGGKGDVDLRTLSALNPGQLTFRDVQNGALKGVEAIDGEEVVAYLWVPPESRRVINSHPLLAITFPGSPSAERDESGLWKAMYWIRTSGEILHSASDAPLNPAYGARAKDIAQQLTEQAARPLIAALEQLERIEGTPEEIARLAQYEQLEYALAGIGLSESEREGVTIGVLALAVCVFSVGLGIRQWATKAALKKARRALAESAEHQGTARTAPPVRNVWANRKGLNKLETAAENPETATQATELVERYEAKYYGRMSTAGWAYGICGGLLLALGIHAYEESL